MYVKLRSAWLAGFVLRNPSAILLAASGSAGRGTLPRRGSKAENLQNLPRPRAGMPFMTAVYCPGGASWPLNPNKFFCIRRPTLRRWTPCAASVDCNAGPALHDQRSFRLLQDDWHAANEQGRLTFRARVQSAAKNTIKIKSDA